jgi:hypothetical protein
MITDQIRSTVYLIDPATATGLKTRTVKAWRYEQLINDLAVGDRPDSELAAEYEVEEQSIRVFRMRHKADVEAKKAGWAEKFDHIWSTKVENRVQVLTVRLEEIEEQIALLHEHARRETETIRSIDPEASEVPVNDRVLDRYSKLQASLLREIADQTGQLPQRVAVNVHAASNPITSFKTVALDAEGNLLGVVSQ